jgi:hypothetical protein
LLATARETFGSVKVADPSSRPHRGTCCAHWKGHREISCCRAAAKKLRATNIQVDFYFENVRLEREMGRDSRRVVVSIDFRASRVLPSGRELNAIPQTEDFYSMIGGMIRLRYRDTDRANTRLCGCARSFLAALSNGSSLHQTTGCSTGSPLERSTRDFLFKSRSSPSCFELLARARARSRIS